MSAECFRAAQRSAGSIVSGPVGPNIPLLPQSAPIARLWLTMTSTSSSSCFHAGSTFATDAQYALSGTSSSGGPVGSGIVVVVDGSGIVVVVDGSGSVVSPSPVVMSIDPVVSSPVSSVVGGGVVVIVVRSPVMDPFVVPPVITSPLESPPVSPGSCVVASTVTPVVSSAGSPDPE
jgi:hypothetical protein